MQAAPAAPRTAALAFIFVTIVLDVLALGIIIPVLPKLVIDFVGDTVRATEIYGLFGTAWAAMQFVFSPLLGALSDRFGRRPVILLSNFGLAFDYLLMALAPTLAWLFVGRVISGITAASITTAGAYIADVTPPERRAAGFGKLGAAFGVGFILGPALGGVLGDVDPRLPFWVAGGLSLVNAMYGVFVLPESLPPERRAPFSWKRANPLGALKLLRRHPELSGLATVAFMQQLAHYVYPSVFVLYAFHRYGWSQKTVGLTLAAVGVFSLIVQGGLVQRVVKQLGERRTLLFGLAAGITGFALYGLSSVAWMFWASMPIMALWGLASPVSQSLMTQRLEAHEQGQLQGALTSLMAFAGLFGPGIFTQVFATAIDPAHAIDLPGAPFYLSSVLLVFGFWIAWHATRGRSRTNPVTSPVPLARHPTTDSPHMKRTLLAASMTTLLSSACAQAAPNDAGFSLTIYSSAAPGALSVEQLANYGVALPGYALVRDARRMDLPDGRGTVRLTDVAKRVDPTTVSFASLTDPDGTRVVEQNFEFDLVDQAKLIERYLGETITVEQLRGENVERTTGKLLSATGGLILQMPSGEVVTLNGWSNVQFPQLPGGLITKPTLVWLVEAERGGTHDARVSYQTQGMTWWADYNVTLREEGGCTMDLSAWVTLVNQSGASYPETQLKLVAGEVNRAPAPQERGMRMEMKMAAAPAALADDGFQESSLFEYHLYTLGRRTDLPDNSTKQLELFPAAMDVACTRQLVASSPMPWYGYGSPMTDQGYLATGALTVGAFVEFENREKNHLGMPLPAGRVRVNQASVDGSLEFVGEDLIKHTPRNEKIRVKLGNSFDVVGERKQVDFKYDDAAETIDETFEVTVRNRKKVAQEVVVREYFYRWSNWQVTAKSHDFAKQDAQTGDFVLNVPADGEATVRYTVRYSW